MTSPVARVPAPWAALMVGLMQGLLLWWLNEGTRQPLPAPWPTVWQAPALLLPLAFTLLGAFVTRTPLLNWGTVGVTTLVTLVVLSHMTVGAPGGAALGAAVAAVGLLFVQAASTAGTWRFEYPLLFRGLVTNVTLLLGGALFMGAVGLLVALVGELFGGIGLDMVTRFLERAPVILALMGAAFAFGVTRLRTRPDLLEVPARVVLALLAWLLPPVAALTVLFVLAVPIAGLQSSERLFQGLLSSSTYLVLTVTMLLLTNAAYQDGEGDRPALPVWAQRFASGVLLLLPLFPLLALYGLSQRVAEYGLTEARVAGLVVALILLVATLGAAWATRRRSSWLSGLGGVNTAVLALTGLVALLLSVPGLLPRQFAVHSQARRLEEPSARSLDHVRFLAYDSGETGRQALRAALQGGLPPTVAVQARDALRLNAYDLSRQYAGSGKPVRPWVFSSAALAGPELTEPRAGSLMRAMRMYGAFDQYCAGGQRPTCQFRYVVVPSEGSDRALVFRNSSWPVGLWFEEKGSQWTRRGRFGPQYLTAEQPPASPNRLKGQEVRLETLATEVVRVGEQVLFLSDSP